MIHWRVLLVLILMLPTGCNIAEGIDALTRPDRTIPAHYHLIDRPSVVLVDDRTNLINPVRLRREIADEATIVLMERDAVDHMISPRDAMAAARRLDQPNRPAAIDRIGEMVGADQVIYVETLAWGLVQGRGVIAPQAAFRVKVIDVMDRTRLFPVGEQDGAESGGMLVRVNMDQAEAQRYSSDSVTALSRELAKRSGDAVARLFVETRLNVHGDPLMGQ